MLTPYATVLAFLVAAWGLVLAVVVARRLVHGSWTGSLPAPHDDEDTAITGSFNFSPRFCLVALVAVVFQGAVALLFPAAVVLRRLAADGHGHGKKALVELLLFVAVLLLAAAYAWTRGDLAGSAKSRGRTP
jgi:NAD(P)H-quinone oxidoreductase subunit 3